MGAVEQQSVKTLTVTPTGLADCQWLPSCVPQLHPRLTNSDQLAVVVQVSRGVGLPGRRQTGERWHSCKV